MSLQVKFCYMLFAWIVLWRQIKEVTAGNNRGFFTYMINKSITHKHVQNITYSIKYKAVGTESWYINSKQTCTRSAISVGHLWAWKLTKDVTAVQLCIFLKFELFSALGGICRNISLFSQDLREMPLPFFFNKIIGL